MIPTGRIRYVKRYWLFGTGIRQVEYKYEVETDIDNYNGRFNEIRYIWITE